MPKITDLTIEELREAVELNTRWLGPDWVSTRVLREELERRLAATQTKQGKKPRRAKRVVKG